MSITELSIGQRVRVRQHHGTVVRVCVCMVRVRFDKSQQVRKLHPANLLPLED